METKHCKKICEFYYNSFGRRVISNYEQFFNYVSRHKKNSLVLYAEWITFDNIVITSVSAIYDSIANSVVKINRESI